MSKITLLCLMLLGFAQMCIAQKDSTTFRIGLTSSPQVAFSLRSPHTNFAAPFFGIVGISKGKVAVTTFYSFSGSSFGGFLSYGKGRVTPYAVGSKNLKTPTGYCGLGAFIPSMTSKGLIFMEGGASISPSGVTPLFSAGVFIPFHLIWGF